MEPVSGQLVGGWGGLSNVVEWGEEQATGRVRGRSGTQPVLTYIEVTFGCSSFTDNIVYTVHQQPSVFLEKKMDFI